MPSRDPLLYLEDIAENIEKVRSFTRGMNREGFLRDEKTVYAVVRALEIISEASRSVSRDVKRRHSEVPWLDIAGAGNVYRHGYPAVDAERVWNTVEQDLDRLHDVARAELERCRERKAGGRGSRGRARKDSG